MFSYSDPGLSWPICYPVDIHNMGRMRGYVQAGRDCRSAVLISWNSNSCYVGKFTRLVLSTPNRRHNKPDDLPPQLRQLAGHVDKVGIDPPPRPRLLPNDIPQLLHRFRVVVVLPSARRAPRQLLVVLRERRRPLVAYLPSHDDGPAGGDGTGLEERHDPLPDAHLVVPPEEMEEARRVHHVKPALQHPQGRRIRVRVEDVARGKRGTEAAPVAEQLVAQLHEFGPQVRAGQILVWRTVGGQLPQDMAEAAAHIEQRVTRLETCEHVCVLRRRGYVQVEEAPAAYAGVVEDGVGFLALVKGKFTSQQRSI